MRGCQNLPSSPDVVIRYVFLRRRYPTLTSDIAAHIEVSVFFWLSRVSKASKPHAWHEDPDVREGIFREKYSRYLISYDHPTRFCFTVCLKIGVREYSASKVSVSKYNVNK